MPVLSDQIAKIIFSGLYKRVVSIKCFLAGEQEQINKAEAFLKDSGDKFTIVEKGPGDTSFERFTMAKIPKHITDADQFLYIHTKGVSEKHADNQNVYWWRTWMEYNLINKFQYCLDLLKEYDIVGVGYTTKMIGPHFSGNFWWSTGKYYNTLPKNPDGTMNIGNGYLDPENFIFQSKNPKYIDIDSKRSNDPNQDWYSAGKLTNRVANRAGEPSDSNRKSGGRRKTYRLKGGSESKIIDTVALLIPTYPKHYEIFYDLLNKLKSNGISIDIHAIFSNKEEYEQFQLKDSVKAIILESVPQDRSVVEYKRLYGLKQMINTPYEYIISCVSETDIVPENFTKENLMAKIDAIFNKKKLYGISAATNDSFKQIMTAAGSVFTGGEYDRLKSATRDFTLYTYFYDIPVYKRENIEDFLQAINYDTLQLTWDHFDNLMHDYYLIVHHGFEVIDISAFARDIGHGPLINSIEDLNKIKELGLGFGCVLGSLWREKKSMLEAERTFLLINTDRS